MRLCRLLVSSLTLAAVSLAPGKADAQSYPAVTFDAVTSYSTVPVSPSYYFSFTVTGVQHGASASSTVAFYDPAATSPTPSARWGACEKQLLVMINRPGRFSLALAHNAGTGALAIEGCALTQLP